MTASSILVAGSANLDFVVRAERIPAPGETVLGRDFGTFPGGKGANQAVACARAGGASTRMLLALGDDAFALPIEASLRDAGVELHCVRVADAATGTAFICVADDADNAITVAPGANARLLPQHLPPLAGVSHLLMQLETPIDTVQAWAEAARSAGVTVALNAAPARELPARLLAAIDLLIVNQHELDRLAGSSGTLAERLQRLPVPNVVVTLGSAGCCARTCDGWFLQRAFPVQAVDTTAAGDTFCGVLLAALGSGAAWPAALARASAAAALACTKPGAQSSIPSFDDVEALLRSAGAAPQDEVERWAASLGLPRR